MGEAKRRQAWIAKGGNDWGRRGACGIGRWKSKLYGKSAEEIALLELQRTQRRIEQKMSRFGMLGFYQKAKMLPEKAIKRMAAVRAQMKKKGASSAARRAYR